MTFSVNNQVQVSVEDLMDTLNSVQAEEATKTRTGIAPRPEKAKDKDEDVLGFFRDMFANSQAKAVEAREAIQPEMYKLAKESAYEVSQARQMAGITRSLTEGGGEIGRKPLPEGTTLRPVAKPPMTTMRDVTGTDEGKLDNEQPLRDLASAVANKQIPSEELEPVAKDEADEIVNTLVEQLTNTRITAGKDVEEPAPVTAETETTGGLMSRRLDTKGETPKVDPMQGTPVLKKALSNSSKNTTLNKASVEKQVKDAVGTNLYAAGILGAFTAESGSNFSSLSENTNYSLSNAKSVFSQAKIDKALEAVTPEVKAKIEAGGRDRSFGEALMSHYGGGGKYHGRGLIHITHDYNYKAVGDRIGVDLVENPELVNDPKYAVPAAIAFLDMNGYFDAEKPPTKQRLHNIVNRWSKDDVKNKRWSAAEKYMKEFGSKKSPKESLRPKTRPERTEE